MEKRYIYADYAATSPVSEAVLNEMLPYFTEQFGNPSSLYKYGRNARKAVENARERTAAVLGCEPSEIYFTSGGTESDNHALRCGAELMAAKGKRHIITTEIEHHAVLNTCEYLEKIGFDVTYLPVGESGIISPEQVKKAITDNTAVVSVMLANNETGTIQPVYEIAELCRERGVLFHTDAVQAVGNIPVTLSGNCIDMLSLSGHKLGAPKGTGVLFIRNGVKLPSLIFGGGQEKGLRSGTENVPAIVGLAKALEDSCGSIPEKSARLTAVRDMIIDGLFEKVPAVRLNGDRACRLPGNINMSFLGTEGEALLLMLDMNGISASGGSACAGGSPSHVLRALGLPPEAVQGSVRFTIGGDITAEDGRYIVDTTAQIVKRVRNMSSLWERYSRESGNSGILKYFSSII